MLFLILSNNNFKSIKFNSDNQDIITYLSFEDILSHLIESIYYETLNASTQRKSTFLYIAIIFNYNKLFKKYIYIESIDKIIDNKQIHKYHLLKGLELKNKYSTTNTNINYSLI